MLGAWYTMPLGNRKIYRLPTTCVKYPWVLRTADERG